jgi:hypothetical protein
MTSYSPSQIYQGKLNKMILQENNRQNMVAYLNNSLNTQSLAEYTEFLLDNNEDNNGLLYILKSFERISRDTTTHARFIEECLAITHNFDCWYPTEQSPMKSWAQEFHNFMKSSTDMQNLQISKLISRMEYQNEEIVRLNRLVSKLQSSDEHVDSEHVVNEPTVDESVM